MNWIVLVIALLLAAGGGYAVFLGADINQVEHGWAHMIAGSVLVSASAILLAMVAVLFKLDGLRKGLKSLAPARPAGDNFAFSPAGPTAAATEPPARKFRTGPLAATPAATTALALAAGAAVASAVAAHSSAGPEPEASVDTAEPPAESGLDFVPSPPEALLTSSLEQAPAAEQPAEMPEAISGAEPAGAGAASETLDPLEGDWLDRALSGEPEAASEAVPEPVPDVAIAEVDALESEVAREMSFGRERAAYPAELPPPEAEPAAAAPQREIIGRHQVADISYIMYADGSIDADDGTQVRHFTSIADLKAHFSPG